MEITRAYLQKKFREYYAGAKIEVRNLEMREWAFVPLKVIPDFVMHRHLSFSSENELKAYILSNPPLHVYHSSAYYEKPGEERMEDKHWIKADLIFDIDADHIPLKKTGNEFEDMARALEIAKKEIGRLYTLLEKDFGVEDMSLVFSGSRGYHIHVHDEDFSALGSAERREIVNYFTLNRISSRNSTQGSRLCRCAARLMLFKIKEKNLKIGKTGRISKKTLERLKNKLSKSVLDRISACDLSPLTKTERRVFEDCFNSCTELMKIHIDEPVTSDTHRLIRLPNSLHGKTGFVVKPLKVDELPDFNPFEDAIAFGSESVKVRGLKPAKLRIGDVSVKIKPGDKTTLPEYVAVFLICRGIVLYGH